MTKWKVSWITPLTWDPDENIFYSEGEPKMEHKEFETEIDNLLAAIWDAKADNQDMQIYSVLKEGVLVANLLGKNHIHRKTLVTVNNFWWKISGARVIPIQTERISDKVKLTLTGWAFSDDDVETTIAEVCNSSYKYISHKVYTIAQWGASLDITPKVEKKSKPPKKEAPKPPVKVHIPRKEKKKRKKKEDRDYVSANLPRKLKKLHGTKAQRKAKMAKGEYQSPKAKLTSVRKKAKNPPTIQKPKRKLSKHQDHLERGIYP